MLTDLDYSEIKSALDGLDEVASQAERKWGYGRLPLLVDDGLRAKFDRQMANVDKVLQHDGVSLGEILAQLAAMRRAWAALDAAAVAQGHLPRTADALECVLPDGTVCLIIDPRSGADPKPDGRRIVVYSTDEIGRMIAAMAETLVVKREFPGAVVERVHVRRPKMNDGLHGLLGDD